MSSHSPITEYLGLLFVVLAGEAVSEGKADRGIQLILYNKLRDTKGRTKQFLAEQFEKRKEFLVLISNLPSQLFLQTNSMQSVTKPSLYFLHFFLDLSHIYT
jgi:hypothetical protein